MHPVTTLALREQEAQRAARELRLRQAAAVCPGCVVRATRSARAALTSTARRVAGLMHRLRPTGVAASGTPACCPA